MSNYQENGIRMYVNAGADSISSCIRTFVNAYAADVQILPRSDQFGPTAYADTEAAWVLSGQAGILGGMRYPMHGRYTSWVIVVVIMNGNWKGQSEVILSAEGASNPFNNLSMRCSMDYRKKLEDMLRKQFQCSASEQIDYGE